MTARIALISMPWHPFNFFSIQLGTLSASLRENGHDVDVYCFYKDFVEYIPKEIYSQLHAASCGEAIFAALLYPDRREQIVVSLASRFSDVEFGAVIDNTEKFIDDIIDHKDWSEYALVGLTTTHEQLTSSICLARALKEKFPGVHVTFGGALLNIHTGKGLLERFPFVDSAVYGEGELTLVEIAARLTAQRNINFDDVCGVVRRTQFGDVLVNPPRQFVDLDTLPLPDFTDYPKHELVSGSGNIVPHIPFEITRGCFYGKCNFCNLDQQWGGVSRKKRTEKVVQEVLRQVQKYESTQILFTDTNISNSMEVMNKLIKTDLNLRIFGEVSGHNVKYDDMRIMRAAGVRVMQVGIESFSARLLKSYRKGISLIKNVEILKWAKELGIDVGYNLIIRYPNETQEDIKETLENLRFVRYFQPPKLINYSFAYFSEAYNNPGQHNVSHIDVPDYYKEIYPEEFLDVCAPLVVLFVRPVPNVDKHTDWGSVEEYVENWTRAWNANIGPHKLIWRDGDSFLTVEEHIGGEFTGQSWCLRGLHRKVYMLCDRDSRSYMSVGREIGVSEDKVERAALDMREEGIMFTHGTRALSLGIRDR